MKIFLFWLKCLPSIYIVHLCISIRALSFTVPISTGNNSKASSLHANPKLVATANKTKTSQQLLSSLLRKFAIFHTRAHLSMRETSNPPPTVFFARPTLMKRQYQKDNCLSQTSLEHSSLQCLTHVGTSQTACVKTTIIGRAHTYFKGAYLLS